MPDLTNKINNHLDTIDKYKEGIKADIEKLFEELNIKNLVGETDQTIDILIQAIIARIIKKYIRPIYKESKRYVKSVVESDKKL